MAALGLCCCATAFSSCGEQGLLFVAVHGLLIVVASLVAEHQLQGEWASVVVVRGLSSCDSQALELRLSSCDTWAQLLCGMWDLPRPGIEPVSPVLAGRFLTTAPPGKSPFLEFENICVPWEYGKRLYRHYIELQQMIGQGDLPCGFVNLFPQSPSNY